MFPHEKIEYIIEFDSISSVQEELEKALPRKEKNEIIMLSVIQEYDLNIDFSQEHEVNVNTKYKTTNKEITRDNYEKYLRLFDDPMLRRQYLIGHHFSEKRIKQIKYSEKIFLIEKREIFVEVIKRREKAFAHLPHEIGIIDPKQVSPMIIFTMPHIPCNAGPIPLQKSHLSASMRLLKKKISMQNLEPSLRPYWDTWFWVPKKKGKLPFTKHLQPMNEVKLEL